MSMKHYLICIFALATLTFIGCSSPKAPEQFAKQNSQPKIYPDYIDVTIPSNIAPTNFMVLEKGEEAVAKFSYPGGEATYGKGMKIQVPEKKWKGYQGGGLCERRQRMERVPSLQHLCG